MLNLVNMQDYTESKCRICNGEEMIPGTNQLCDCVYLRIQQQKIMSLFKSAQIPKRFTSKLLDNFDKERQPSAHKVATEYVSNWQENQAQGKGIFFTGPVGCGKTHLAFAIVNELVKRGVKSLAATVPDLMDDLRPQTDGQLDKKIETLKTIDLLVLDDLGAQRNTEWVTERIFVVLNARYNNLLPTIITSNTYLEELEKVQGWGRMVDRLLEMCQLVRMKGTSYRLDSVKGDI